MVAPLVVAGIIGLGTLAGSAIWGFFNARADIDKTVEPAKDVINNPNLTPEDRARQLEAIYGTGDGEKPATDGGSLFSGLLPAINVDLSGVVSSVLPAVAIIAGGLILVKAVKNNG